MATAIERTGGHYEVESVPHGRNYAWHPDRVVVLCDCEEKLELTLAKTTCGCGADHSTLVREELEPRNGNGRNPHLEEERHRWRVEKDEYLRSEESYWQELKELD